VPQLSSPLRLVIDDPRIHLLSSGKEVLRSFIHCTQFGAGGFGEKIRREGGMVFELNSGYDAMIKQLQALAAILSKHAW
jgi:hypothetical protein